MPYTRSGNRGPEQFRGRRRANSRKILYVFNHVPIPSSTAFFFTPAFRAQKISRHSHPERQLPNLISASAFPRIVQRPTLTGVKLQPIPKEAALDAHRGGPGQLVLRVSIKTCHHIVAPGVQRASLLTSFFATAKGDQRLFP